MTLLSLGMSENSTARAAECTRVCVKVFSEAPWKRTPIGTCDRFVRWKALLFDAPRSLMPAPPPFVMLATRTSRSRLPSALDIKIP